MKTILCYGDSNTYGESPEGIGRYEPSERWTGILQDYLKDNYTVIEEGLNGRTTVWEDPVEGDKNGLRQLRPILESHTPLDLLIIMLGSNDFKKKFSVTPADIALSVERLVLAAKETPNYKDHDPFKIMVMNPPVIQHHVFLGEIFGDRHEDSKRLGPYLKEMAARNQIYYLDLAQYASASELDGLHMDRANHKKAADAIKNKVLEIL